MTVDFKYLTLTALLALLLIPWAISDAAEEKISDFDGVWEGKVECRYQGGGYKQRVSVGIENGGGALTHFAKRDKTFTAKLNPKNGKITWRGEYQIYGQPRKRSFSVKGKWMGDKFKLKGRHDRASCSGVLSKRE